MFNIFGFGRKRKPPVGIPLQEPTYSETDKAALRINFAIGVTILPLETFETRFKEHISQILTAYLWQFQNSNFVLTPDGQLRITLDPLAPPNPFKHIEDNPGDDQIHAS